MFDWFRNLQGHFKGYGGCHHCGDRWNWKKEHRIPYAESKIKTHLDGTPYYYAHMFPLCGECYEKLSPETRLHYCEELYYSWNRPEKDIDWSIIRDHVGLRPLESKVRNEK